MAKDSIATRPQQSALSKTISADHTRSYRRDLALEIVHNLRCQHNWTDLEIYHLQKTSGSTSTVTDSSNSQQSSDSEDFLVISGLPPQHTYLHPDFTAHLLSNDIPESTIPVQREVVLPLSLGEKRSLKQFSRLFDRLPQRDVLKGRDGWEWRDAKRILTAMRADPGMGGDGTVAYYVMQEGAIKPRQNG